MAINAFILRTNETTLKGGNRGRFEARLVDDVAARLKRFGGFAVRREQGNVIAVRDAALDEATAEACMATLTKAFGANWVLPAARCEKTMDAITATAVALAAPLAPSSFKVFGRRSDKHFPLNSQEIAVSLGQSILERIPGMGVDVHEPKMRVNVDVSDDFAYVSVERYEGAGGLPNGVAGPIVAMLSGGIDSPVAAWKMMRRGCTPTFVHFHSYPYVGAASLDKVKRLATELGAYGYGGAGGFALHLVPIGDAQREITAKADESCRVLLYRRLMLRLAENIGRESGSLGIVTGESVGQVASQTLENMAAVSAVTAMPIYRPLVGDDKEDIVRVARRIGTYDISIEPHDDCCSLFVPQHPATRSSAAKLDAEEKKYDVDSMMADAMARRESM